MKTKTQKSPSAAMLIKRLASIPLFDGLAAKELLRALPVLDWQEAAAGTVLFTEGSRGDVLYFIEKGKVVISKKTKGTKEQDIAIFTDGEFFGEMSLLEAKPRSATARTLEATELVAITSKKLFQWVHKDPKAAIHIGIKAVRGMSERLRQTTTELTSLHNLATTLLAAKNSEDIFASAAEEFSKIITPDVATGGVLFSYNPYVEEFKAEKHWGQVPAELLTGIKELPADSEGFEAIALGPKKEAGQLLIVQPERRGLLKKMPLIQTFASILSQAITNTQNLLEEQLRSQLKITSISI